jgi:hypothetical protein
MGEDQGFAVSSAERWGWTGDWKGDLMTFPEGLDCSWAVWEKAKKHYRFG